MSTFGAIKTRQGMVGSQSAIHTTIYTRERSLSKPMANKTQTTTLLTADVEFEPYCEWQKDDASDTLVVHLPGMPHFTFCLSFEFSLSSIASGKTPGLDLD